MLPEEALPKTTVFLRDDKNQCCLMDYQFMGFMKEAGNTLKSIVEYEVPSKGARSKKKGIKNLRSKLSQFLYIGPRIIHLGRTPDGIYERPSADDEHERSSYMPSKFRNNQPRTFF